MQKGSMYEWMCVAKVMWVMWCKPSSYSQPLRKPALNGEIKSRYFHGILRLSLNSNIKECLQLILIKKFSSTYTAVSFVLWKEPFSYVSGRFYLFSLRSGEKMSFPGWSTDLHINPNIRISSQQHSNRCTWFESVSSTKPVRGVTNTQTPYRTHSIWRAPAALQMLELYAQNYNFYNAFCHFWSMTAPLTF